MFSPSKSPRSRSKNSMLMTLSPKSSHQTGKFGTTRIVNNNFGGQNSYANNSSNMAQIRFRNCQPRLNYHETIVHVDQELLSFTDLKIDPKTKYLDVQHNCLVDFKGLPSLQMLEELNCSYNDIQNLYCFPPLPKLKKIECAHTPFSATECYRIALLLICPSLHSIDKEMVKTCERRVAKEFNSECVHLLRSGWILRYPPPTRDQIIGIKRKLTKQNRKKIQSQAKVKFNFWV